MLYAFVCTSNVAGLRCREIDISGFQFLSINTTEVLLKTTVEFRCRSSKYRLLSTRWRGRSFCFLLISWGTNDAQKRLNLCDNPHNFNRNMFLPSLLDPQLILAEILYLRKLIFTTKGIFQKKSTFSTEVNMYLCCLFYHRILVCVHTQ